MVLLTKAGLLGGLRISHVVFAAMWMGLLWFFNFVQTPAYAEMDPAARNNAFDKVTWRALWWFRWAAMATFVSGLVILAVGASDTYNSDFWKTPSGGVLATAILFGTIMAANVWMVIWPNQQIVIANARTVAAGGEANPEAPKAARRGAMASRQNTIFSFTVFLGMVGASHFFYAFDQAGGGVRALFYIIILAIAIGMELNALGKFGTEVGKPNTKIYDTHQNAIYTGIGILVFIWLFFEIFVGKAPGL
jgi:uncharacterized membrane protein